MEYSQYSSRTRDGYIPEPPERPGFWERLALRLDRARLKYGLFLPRPCDPLATVMFLRHNLVMRLYPVRVATASLRYPGFCTLWPACLVFLLAALSVSPYRDHHSLVGIYMTAFILLLVLRFILGLCLFKKSCLLLNTAVTVLGVVIGIAVFMRFQFAGFVLLVVLLLVKWLDTQALARQAQGFAGHDSLSERALRLGEVQPVGNDSLPSPLVFSWPVLPFRELFSGLIALLAASVVAALVR